MDLPGIFNPDPDTKGVMDPLKVTVVKADELDELSDRLRRMFAARDDHILFFDAADDASYGFAVEVMDRAREGGAVTIAALTSALESSNASPPGGT